MTRDINTGLSLTAKAVARMIDKPLIEFGVVTWGDLQAEQRHVALATLICPSPDWIEL